VDPNISVNSSFHPLGYCDVLTALLHVCMEIYIFAYISIVFRSFIAFGTWVTVRCALHLLSYGRLSNSRADSRAVQSQTLQVLTKPVAAFHAAVASVASSVRVGRQQALKDRRALTRTVTTEQ